MVSLSTDLSLCDSCLSRAGSNERRAVSARGSRDARSYQFGWVNIDSRMNRLKMDLEGTHEITVNVHGTGIGTSAGVQVYDRPEAPSGMTFNLDPATLEDGPVSRA